MLSRRDFLTTLATSAALMGGMRTAANGTALLPQPFSLEQILDQPPFGQVTLLHLPDLHAQLTPLYLREPPSPALSRAALAALGIAADSPAAYALSPESFDEFAARYGHVGGVAHLATVLFALRAQRPQETLVFDGGDSWQGSYGALMSQGQEMITVMQALGVDAMTGHWEFTYGQDRIQQALSTLPYPFLAANITDTTWNEPQFPALTFFERGGLKIAVIGQAYPYTPIANPRHLIPDWSFGIREDLLRRAITQAQDAKSDLVVLLSHNGLDIDCKLASRVGGLHVILSGHTHEALPQALKINETLIITGGSHGKVLAQLDLAVKDRRVTGYRFRQIPILSALIPADPTIAALVETLRRPYQDTLRQPLAETDGLLSRRGTLGGGFDDLLCDALRRYHDTEIALSPGFRWGGCLPAGSVITREDIYGQTAITYAASYRRIVQGAEIKEILEDVADNLFHPDPYYRQGGDMVRTGGLSYRLRALAARGQRIEDLTLTRTGEPIVAGHGYSVAGWASVGEHVAAGPPMWDLAEQFLTAHRTLHPRPRNDVQMIP